MNNKPGKQDDDYEKKEYIVAKEDITQREKLQEQLIKNNKDLTETINRLKETQTQLIQQEQLAGIGQLAAGIAHEINNPLGFINSNFRVLSDYIKVYKTILNLYSDLKNEIISNNYQSNIIKKIIQVEKENDIDYINEDIDALLNDSNEGLERVGKIIEGLRLFSRVDYLDKFEMYDLNEGIKTTLIVAKNEIKYVAQVEVDYGELPLINAIGGQINQVLLNIIVNATQAIKEKESNDFGLIKINTYRDSEYVYMEIEDNGIGVSNENITKIFNPFFTTKPIGEGTGLGLGIAYDIIVKKHNGNIWVESKLNKSTCFHIKLPIDQDK